MPEDLMRRRNGTLQNRKMVHDQEVGIIKGDQPFHLIYRTLLTLSIQKTSNNS